MFYLLFYTNEFFPKSQIIGQFLNSVVDKCFKKDLSKYLAYDGVSFYQWQS